MLKRNKKTGKPKIVRPDIPVKKEIVMPREVLTEVPEKQKIDFSTVEMARMLANQQKALFEDWQQKVSLKKTEYSSVEESLKRQQAYFNQKMSTEKQAFNSEKELRLSQIKMGEDSLEKRERNYNERLMRLQSAEQAAAAIEQERKVIFNKRIELENLINHNTVELKKTMEMQSRAQDRLNTAAEKTKEVKEALKEIKAVESLTQSIKEQNGLKEKEILAQIENLENLRQEVMPAMEALAKEKSAKEKLLKDIEKKENIIDAKIADDKRMLTEIEARGKQQARKEIELNTREQEVVRRETMERVK